MCFGGLWQPCAPGVVRIAGPSGPLRVLPGSIRAIPNFGHGRTTGACRQLPGATRASYLGQLGCTRETVDERSDATADSAGTKESSACVDPAEFFLKGQGSRLCGDGDCSRHLVSCGVGCLSPGCTNTPTGNRHPDFLSFGLPVPKAS